jgi:hypothetical protein
MKSRPYNSPLPFCGICSTSLLTLRRVRFASAFKHFLDDFHQAERPLSSFRGFEILSDFFCRVPIPGPVTLSQSSFQPLKLRIARLGCISRFRRSSRSLSLGSRPASAPDLPAPLPTARPRSSALVFPGMSDVSQPVWDRSYHFSLKRLLCASSLPFFLVEPDCRPLIWPLLRAYPGSGPARERVCPQMASSRP